jgi:hypothetical protein
MRRLSQPQRASSFLLADDPVFGPALRDCLEKARRGTTPSNRLATIEAVLKAIQPFDLAGLGDSSRRNWHPCCAEDLLAAAPKLGVERGAVEQLLARCGFAKS